ncbi:glycosyltransferase [Ureibacillus terrenus]|uniref:glycosyltransferase n=1 Tax=Ureibacillus terrenus TaxID=118246 RepID=UPI002E23AACA|nr:glycosyltransferase [Ureibacillus terrenus]
MKVCKLIRRHSFKDVRVFEKEAISLKKLGYDVTIVAGKKNGKVFGPDRKPVSDSAFKNAKFVYQNINFLTYDIGTVNQFSVNQMIKALEKNTQNYFVDKLYQKALSTNADIYHAHELHALYDAVQIKRTLRKKGKKVKVIFDAHELEANSKLMSLLMKEVDHLITVSDSIKEIYQKRYPNVPATVIYNSPNFQEDLTSKDHYFSNSFVVAYEGVVTYQKGDPRKIINIANLCKKAIKNFRFEIFGYVYPGLKEKMPSKSIPTSIANGLTIMTCQRN